MGGPMDRRILVTGALGQIGMELLEALSEKFGAENIVIACSALKQKYRELLGAERYQLVYLKIDESTARKRLSDRVGHFMPASLIDSQFAILEEPVNALTFDHGMEPADIIDMILRSK